ncbi:MAG: prepilin peptidase [Candidatus Omnitrophica bacterium]|nr:prepilin peptidase [Candidatus Omnitrophota bacterium]
MIIIDIYVFIFGAIIGSFLNVCIVRMPEEKSVVLPRSHCVKCKKTIPWYDNVPLLSYLLLRGKCRFCKEKFSFLYFFVELLTAVTFVLFYRYFGFSKVLFPYLAMVSGFIVATMVDFKHRIIPDEISVGGMCAGLVFSLFIPEMHGLDYANRHFLIVHLHSLGLSFLGAFVGGGSVYFMGILGDFLFKKESIGGGDVKLLAMVGAFLGWKLALLSFFIAPFFGAIFGLIEMLRTKDTAIAYGPFLVLGSLISLFYGDWIILWIINGYRF